jgi:phosphoenolpyruvate carboxykinase (ATP)
VFGLEIPTEIEGVPSGILNPINTVSWLFISFIYIYMLLMFFGMRLICFDEVHDPLELQWSDKDAYKDTIMKLGGLFKKNFEGFLNYKIGEDNKLTEEILAAGPVF